MPDVMLHNETSQSILKTLLYYDIFQYPLTSEEIFRYLGTNHVTIKDVRESVNHLSGKGYIFEFNGFYSLHNNSMLVSRRLNGNARARQFMTLARQKAKLIYSFPFVRSVMASGSLSKDFMDDKSDLDFFIITSPNRLWVARTLLVLYKRILFFNSHRFFCVNYFIDHDHLEIEEKNIFTATELATLIPLCNDKFYRQLFEKNSWLRSFFPNHTLRKGTVSDDSNVLLKSVLERLINFCGGDWWDIFFMNITNQRWNKLYGKGYSSEDFQIAFKTKRYTSKNHPNHYQKKIVTLYKEKLAEFAKKFDIQWLHE